MRPKFSIWIVVNNFGVSIETDYELHYDDDLYANHVLRLPQHPLEYNGVFEAVKEEVKKEHTDQDMIEFANYCAYKIGENRLGGKSTWKELLDEYKKQKTT